MSEQAEPIAILEHFSALADPRQAWKVLYPLPEVLLVVLCGVLSGADSFVEIAEWGRMKIDFLRQFLPYKHGIPSHDALNDLFNALEPGQFQDCFVRWVAGLRADDAEIIAVDGKTARRTGDKERSPLHMVSAWASRQRLVLGQEAVADKSNEIVAIPELLQKLVLKGALVTIDAMGCQRDIAEQIIGQGGDYLLALKGNQGTLFEDVTLFFNEQRACRFANAAVAYHETTDADHGRLEVRRHWITSDIGWLQERHDWPGLVSIGMIESQVSKDGKTTLSKRFYISSLPADAVTFARAARAHWGIENSLHWVLDVVFHDDLSRLRSGYGPQNFGLVKHMAINLLKTLPGRNSMNVKRKKAAWGTEFLAQVLTGVPN